MTTFDFTVIRAIPDPVRQERINVGIVVFDGKNTCVKMDESPRLATVFPEYKHITLKGWSEQVETALRQRDNENQKMFLPFLIAPFQADSECSTVVGETAAIHCETMYFRLVEK